MCLYLCTCVSSHPGYPQVGYVQMESVEHWWGSGVRGSWAVGRGSNGSRNRPCSTAPGSLIIVSAANVFGVREWYPIPPLSAAACPQNTGQISLSLPLALSPLHLSVSPYLLHLPSMLFVRVEMYVYACANVLSAHVGVCAPLIAHMCAWVLP